MTEEIVHHTPPPVPPVNYRMELNFIIDGNPNPVVTQDVIFSFIKHSLHELMYAMKTLREFKMFEYLGDSEDIGKQTVLERFLDDSEEYKALLGAQGEQLPEPDMTNVISIMPKLYGPTIEDTF